MLLMLLARLYTWPWQNPELHRDSATEYGSVASWFHCWAKEGVPHYNTRGADAESAAVEAAGVVHELLEVIVMEGACLLPLVCRACYVSVIVNRGRLARVHASRRIPDLQGYTLLVLALLIPRWRDTPSGQLKLLVVFSFLFLSFFGLGLHSPFFPCLRQLEGVLLRYAAIAFCFAKIA